MIFVVPLPAALANVRYQWLANGSLSAIFSNGIAQVGTFFLFRINTSPPSGAEELIVFDSSDPTSYAVAHYAEIMAGGTGGAGSDPWAAPLPGTYAAGTAGEIVGSIQQGKVTVISPVSQSGDNKIAVRAGDSWSIPITGLGDISTRTKLWFALKDTPDIADNEARAFVEETDGLTVLNGWPYPDNGDGGLVVTDEGLGNLTVIFEEAATIALYGALAWSIKILNAAGNTVTLATGPFLITKAEIAANT